MSRRKQSNPKPLKHGPSDEESEDGGRRAITPRPQHDKMELPPGILEFQPCDEEGREFAVCGAIRLPRGSSLGPFQGEITSTELIHEENLPVIKFLDPTNRPVYVLMGENGRWITQLKVKDENTANSNIYFDGEKIWCEIRKDVLIHSELTAVFTTQSEDIEEELQEEKISPPLMPRTISRPDISPSGSSRSHSVGALAKSPGTSPVHSPEQSPTVHPLIFACPFCAVRFSSPRTLDAHIQFYCSKKPTDFLLSPTSQPFQHPASISPIQERQQSTGSKGSVTLHSGGLRTTKEVVSPDPQESRSADTSPLDKPCADRDLLRCADCSYTCWLASSLNRHRLKIHNQTDTETAGDSHSPSFIREMYCFECNIQFSSLTTFQGHKDYYCPKKSTRPLTSPGVSPKQTSTVSSNGQNSENQASMFTSNIIPVKDGASIYSSMGGIVVPTQLLSQSIPVSMGNQPAVLLTAPILAHGGLTNITMPAIIMQPMVQQQQPSRSPVHTDSSPKRSDNQAEECLPFNIKGSQPNNDELPLDLSTKSSSSKKGTTALKEESPDSNKRDRAKSKRRISDDGRPQLDRQHSSGSGSEPTQSSPQNVPSHSDPMLNVSPIRDHAALNPNGFLLYDHLGTPFITKDMIHNPALLYGLQGHAGDSDFAGLSPNVSKCMDCNIVFFKRENFLIHRKHYCASRKRHLSGHSDDQSISSKNSEVSNGVCDPLGGPNIRNNCDKRSQTKHKPKHLQPLPDSRQSDSRLTANEDQAVQHIYFCTTCSIRFSSADTLQAHKEFYCSDIKLNSRTSLDTSSVPDQDDNLRVTKNSCSKCGHTYPSSRLLKQHICNSSQSNMSALRCLYCTFVAQTENKYFEHMKAHAPSKIYRCALCGYRGNTIRGMRMHGKMHTDEGTEFNDDHMLEFEEPPLIPTTLKSEGERDSVGVEAELIRIKNEPYKRRRSRKAFEKSEYCPVPKKQGRHVCAICYEIYPDCIKLNEHMQMQVADCKYACRSCKFSTDRKSDLIKHMSTHELPVIKTERSESPEHDINVDRVTPESHDYPATETPKSPEEKSPRVSPDLPERKIKISPSEENLNKRLTEQAEKENVPVGLTFLGCPRPHSNPENCTELSTAPDKHDVKYCKYCDINFTFTATFEAHRQYYCSGGYTGVGDSDSSNPLGRQEH